MHRISINNIKLYAYHGCLEEEGRVGGNYSVDVTMETDFSEAAKTDELSKTIDYVMVFNIVKEQMAIRSKLIEQVAQRIVNALRKEIPSLHKLEVTLTKINPPMHGDVESVSVTITE